MKRLARIGGKAAAYAAFIVIWFMLCVVDGVPDAHLAEFLALMFGVLMVFIGGIVMYVYGRGR